MGRIRCRGPCQATAGPVAGCVGPCVPWKGSSFQRVRVPPRQRSSQPGSYPSGYGGNEVVEAWETEGGVRPSASWQAVTRVNTEGAPKDTMRRPTLLGLGEGWHGSGFRTTYPICFAGVVGDGMSTRSDEQAHRTFHPHFGLTLIVDGELGEGKPPDAWPALAGSAACRTGTRSDLAIETTVGQP
jgi:hypothetical protein